MYYNTLKTYDFRVDGYTSDTTAFADDDDDFSVPLHVNTRTPLRTDSISPQAPDRYINIINNVNNSLLIRHSLNKPATYITYFVIGPHLENSCMKR